MVLFNQNSYKPRYCSQDLYFDGWPCLINNLAFSAHSICCVAKLSPFPACHLFAPYALLHAIPLLPAHPSSFSFWSQLSQPFLTPVSLLTFKHPYLGSSQPAKMLKQPPHSHNCTFDISLQILSGLAFPTHMNSMTISVDCLFVPLPPKSKIIAQNCINYHTA